MSALREKIISNFSDSAVIENFRLGANGELNKREGYLCLNTFDANIRGAVSSGSTVYVVSGSKFYSVSGGKIVQRGTLSGASFASSTEKVTMFIASNIVFILGGKNYYRYDISKNSFSAVIGYAPILDTTDTSEDAEIISEPRNIFTKTVRRRFRLKFDQNTYVIPEQSTQLNWVKVDGVLLSKPDQYDFDIVSSKINIHIDYSDFPDQERIMEVEYVLKSYAAMDKSRITNCRKAYQFTSESVSVLFLYDNPNFSPGSIIYSRQSASPTDAYGVSDYFPEGQEIVIGDGSKPIRGIAQLGDRIIVATSDGIYSLNPSIMSSGKVKFYVSHLSSDFGASENSGIAVFGNYLYLANETGLFRMSYDSLTGNLHTVQINIPELAIASRSDYKNIKLHINRQNSELWCYTANGIGVYSIRYGTWYRFSGITADFFFSSNSQTAFALKKELHIFDNDTVTDNGVGFEAFIESTNLNFDNVFTEKTIYGFGAAFERRSGAALECLLLNDKGNEFRTVIESDGSGLTSPVVLHTHARLGKSAYIIYRISSPSYASPANVREIMFRYRTTGV